MLRHDGAAGACDVGKIGDRPEIEHELVLAVEHLIVDLEIEGDGRRNAVAGQHGAFDPWIAGRRLRMIPDRPIDRDLGRVGWRNLRNASPRHILGCTSETAVDRNLIVGGIDVESVVAFRRVSDELDGATGTEDPGAVDPTGDG